jgi:predicted transcriptional regulator
MMRTIKGEGEHGAGPTKILYGANLSYDRLTQYLEELVEKELISETEVDAESRVYHLTTKGNDFLQEFTKVERFSEAFGIEI